jgi:hypothetical protein
MIEGLDVVDRSTREIDMCRIGAALLGDAGALKGGPPVVLIHAFGLNLHQWAKEDAA